MELQDPISFDQVTRREVADQLWKLFGFESNMVEIFYAHSTIHVTIHLKKSTGDAQGTRTYINDWNTIREDRPSFS